MGSWNSMGLRLTLLCGGLISCSCEKNDRPLASDAQLENVQSPAHAAAEPNETPKTSVQGEKQFNSYCAACHQRGGQGEEGRVPPLDGSPWVSGSEERLVRIVLNGLRGPIEIRGETYNLEMPAFRTLFRDDDIASVLSYVRQRYGNSSLPITSTTVARVRQKTQDRIGYWTVEELLHIP